MKLQMHSIRFTADQKLVDFIQKYGANVDQDLEQLWRRIVFSISVTNTDDHLRNHGFILQLLYNLCCGVIQLSLLLQASEQHQRP